MRSHLVAPIAGAFTWVAITMIRLWSVNDSFWIAHDDAVITLSHARNAARFGSIGVSPGGDRVEGFSSPLHFVTAYLLQVVARPGYRTMTLVILVVSIAAAGATLAWGLQRLAQRSGVDDSRSSLVVIGLTAAVAIAVAVSWTSVGWIGSGMENPIVIVTGLGAGVGAVASLGSRGSRMLVIVMLALFMISRVEFAAFGIPLVVAAAWMVASWTPPGQRRLELAQVAVAPLLLVAVVHLSRRLYFGEWLPNTARVQDRSTGLDQLLGIGVIAVLLLALLAIAIVRLSALRPDLRSILTFGLTIAATISIITLTWLDASGRTAGSMLNLLLLQPLMPLLVLIAVLLQAQRFVDSTPWLPNHVFGALAAVPLAQYVVTGPARLDDYRIAVIAVPFLALWAAALGLHVLASISTVEHRAAPGQRFTRAGIVGLVAATALGGLGWTASKDPARPLNYEITGAPQIIEVVRGVRDLHLDGTGLVILANPDLGKVSFDKSAIMVDLGLLGDPLLTLISHDRPDLVGSYMQRVARPDVLESHAGWSCKYGDWLDSDDFADHYELSDDRWLSGRGQSEECLLDGRWAIWVRSDAEDEYRLTRELINASDPAGVTRSALDSCSQNGDGQFRCENVRRSLQRASAALRSAGTFSSAVAAIRVSPSAALDVALLQRDAGWATDAFSAFVELADDT